MIAQYEKDQKPVAHPATGFRRIIPLDSLGGSLPQALGTLGTPFFNSHAHAEKTYFLENHISPGEREDLEKSVPNVPNAPVHPEGRMATSSADTNIRRIIPLGNLGGSLRHVLGTLGTPFFNSHARAEKTYFLENHISSGEREDLEKSVPSVPTALPFTVEQDRPVEKTSRRQAAALPPAAVPQSSRPHQVVADRAGLDEVVSALQGESAIALDIETHGTGKGDALDPWKGEIRLLQLAGEQTCVFLLDLKALGYDLGPLADLLASKLIIGHNLRFDARWLRVKCELRLPQPFCTLTAARLLSAGTKPGNNLDQCLERYCGISPAKDESRSDWGGMLLTDDQIAYAVRDVAHLHLLKGRLDHELGMAGLDGVFALESRLLPVVIDMEVAGMAVDAGHLRRIESSCRGQAEAVAAEVRSLLGRPELNLGSSKQLLAALQGRGIDLVATNEEALRSCGEKEIVPKILAHRAFEKQAQQAATLVESIASDGRIHGQFDPMGTATGRFSSKSPNLQNIGRGELRSCFIAPEGRSLVIADYSQIELRASAAIAGETRMIEAYSRGQDLHKITASAVLGKPLADITKEDRQKGKSSAFGLLYGQSAKGLVRYAKTSYGVNLTEDEAHAIRQKFFATYGNLRQWHGHSHRSAEDGVTEIRTVTGRRRLIPSSASEWERFTALVNTPVQGSCADGLKQALIDLSTRLPEGAKIVSTVHDEIIVECDRPQAEDVRELLQSTMREAMGALFPQVPIEVEAGICSNWGEKP